jgi:hypothetical protein
MYDAKLPFGHARSPKIFQQLSASVCSIMKCTYNVTCIAYLDDFLVIADSFSKCQRGIRSGGPSKDGQNYDTLRTDKHFSNLLSQDNYYI